MGQSFARHALVDGAGQAVARKVRVGANRVQSQEPLPGHLGGAGREVVFGPSEGLGHVPPLPVFEETVALRAVEAGIFEIFGAALLVVARDLHQIHRTADAILREEHRFLRRARFRRESRAPTSLGDGCRPRYSRNERMTAAVWGTRG